jgi:hypothetical protein
MIKFGAAAMHIEDQVGAKRCGHRPNKEIVSQQEMVDRIKAAVDARTDDSFVIMARTDALAVEGLDAAIDRAVACVEAGADMIFPEAITELEMYKTFADRVKAPILANITEFGATPLYTTEELASADVSLVLYPLSAFRAMNKAAENVYTAMRRDGTQKNVVDTMQTRMELYDASATTPSSRSSMRCLQKEAQALRIKIARPNKFESTMAEAKVLSGAGLRGQVAGRPHCDRGPGRRRPDLSRLRHSRPGRRREFEEVAYLLLYGELPTKAELADYKRKLKGLRDLPQALKEVLEACRATPTRWT